MAMWSKRWSPGTSTAEPLGYAAAAISIFILVSTALTRLGVDPKILIWSACLVFTGIILLASNTTWPSRLSTFAVADRRSSPSMIACGQIMAFGPAGLVIAHLTDGPYAMGPVYLTLLGLITGLWLSTLLVGVRLNRSGAYSLPRFLEVRFRSTTIRLVSIVVLVPSILALIGGQFVSFAILSHAFIGIPLALGISICSVLAVVLCWPTGARGILLAGMVCVAAMVITFAPVYWGAGSGLPVGSSTVIPGTEDIAGAFLAAASLLFEAELMQAGWANQLVFVVAVAAAVAVSPICVQFHPLSASGTKTVRVALAASVLVLAFAALATAIEPLGASLSLDPAAGASGNWLFVALACVVVLLVFPVTAATLLLGLVGLLTFDGFAGSSPVPKAENRQLIWSRLMILMVAFGVVYGATYWRHEFAGILVVPFFVSAAALFPATAAAFWWQRCTAAAAFAGIVVGAVVTLLIWSLGAGILEARGLVSGGSAVLDLLSEQSISGAALFGLVGGTICMMAIAFSSGPAKPEAMALLEAVSEDQPRRVLNEGLF